MKNTNNSSSRSSSRSNASSNSSSGICRSSSRSSRSKGFLIFHFFSFSSSFFFFLSSCSFLFYIYLLLFNFFLLHFCFTPTPFALCLLQFPSSMSQEYTSAQPTRRSWNPIVFPINRADNTSSPPSPTTTFSSTSSIDKRQSLDPSTILLQRNNSTGSKRSSFLLDTSKSVHRRTNSVFSSSQYSSSSLATSISRSSSPEYTFDSLDEAKQYNKRQQQPRSQRWSTSSAGLRYSVSEQERLLQEKLALLARTENLRLLAYENSSSASSSPAPSRPLSLNIDVDKNRISSIISSSPSFLHRHSSYSHLNATFKALDLNDSSSVDISQSSCDVARADALAKLSGATTTTTSMPMAPSKQASLKTLERKKKRSSLNYSGRFVISDQDLEKIGHETLAMAGPFRPSDIGGTVLSWRMAGDLLKAWFTACRSPDSFLEIVYFLWAMVSYPSNVLELDFETVQLMPPQEIVQNLKENVVSTISQASLKSILDSLIAFSKILGQGAVTGVAFLVIFIQVSLLTVMVFAYMLGETIITPVNYAKDWYSDKSDKNPEVSTPDRIVEIKALKAQRAARKSALRRSRVRKAQN